MLRYFSCVTDIVMYVNMHMLIYIKAIYTALAVCN